MSGPFSAVNHVGFVVSNLEQALAFFTDVFGFERIEGRTGSILPEGDALTRRFGIDSNASGEYAFVRLGESIIELLVWSAPGQHQSPPLNSDWGGRHLALSVRDMPSAIALLGSVEGVVVREANDMGYVYCLTTFGLEVQLIPV